MRTDERISAGIPAARVQGFTLIELLVTLSIVVALALVAVPNMGSLLVDSRISETRGRLFSTLSLARSEAIRRGQRVAVCSAVFDTVIDDWRCKEGSSNIKAVWRTALLFENVDGDRLYDPSQGDRPVRVVDLAAGAEVFWNNRSAIVFDHDGSIWGVTNGSFYVFERSAIDAGVRLVLQKTGRLRQQSFNAADVNKLRGYLDQ